MSTPELPVLFSWVHLSDLHFGHGNAEYGFDQKLVLDALKRDVGQVVTARRVPAPAAVLVSGDVAFSGAMRSPGEYADAHSYLLELAVAVGLGPAQLFVVPGNHDVQRSADAEGTVRRLIAALRAGDEALDQVLAVEAERQLLARRQANFERFARELAPTTTTGGSGRLDAWMHRFLSHGLRVRLVGLNTALLSAGDDDQGKLRVGLGALAATLLTPPPEEGELVVAMGHHPLRDGWLANQSEVIGWLRRHGCVYLSGHIHTHESADAHTGSGQAFVQVSAGAAHAERGERGEERHGYNFAAVVAGPGGRLLLRVWPRTWDSRGKRFIVDRSETREDCDYAEHPLAIASPAGTTATAARPEVAAPDAPATASSSGSVRPLGRMSELRQLLEQLLPTEADIEALCDDSFPQLQRKMAGQTGAAKLDRLAATEDPTAIRLALLGHQTKRQRFRDPPSSSSAPQNPYHPRGLLAIDHPTYVKRPCDEELARCLNDKRLQRTVIYGDYGCGKSSLLERAENLSDRQFAHISLEALDTSNPKSLIKGFWMMLARGWGLSGRREITLWDDLAPDSPDHRLGILIDEFGRLDSAALALPFLDSLLQYAAKHHIPVVICLARTLEEYFRKVELENDKWRGGWGKVQVTVFGHAEILTLMSHLPATTHPIVIARFDKLLKRSGRIPRRLQCVLSAIFDVATMEGLSGKALGERISKLLDDEQSYV